MHPVQTETFAIHEGRCRVVIDGVESEAGPGDVIAVPPGVSHLGQVDAEGLPTPLHLAVLADDHRDLVYLTAAPVWLQRAAFAVLAKLGRLLGRGAGGLAPEPA